MFLPSAMLVVKPGATLGSGMNGYVYSLATNGGITWFGSSNALALTTGLL